ncbi:hypothetical protein [Brevundimonas sp.]|uniref:hypothetical protein n=1 Tax=Brevundimonas sp. TaxID=1871086 RepID=UPI0035B17CC0
MGGFSASALMGTGFWLVSVLAISLVSYRLGRRRLALLPVGLTTAGGLFSGYFVGWYNGQPSASEALHVFVQSFGFSAMAAVWIMTVVLAVALSRSGGPSASLAEAPHV